MGSKRIGNDIKIIFLIFRLMYGLKIAMAKSLISPLPTRRFFLEVPLLSLFIDTYYMYFTPLLTYYLRDIAYAIYILSISSSTLIVRGSLLCVKDTCYKQKIECMGCYIIFVSFKLQLQTLKRTCYYTSKPFTVPCKISSVPYRLFSVL